MVAFDICNKPRCNTGCQNMNWNKRFKSNEDNSRCSNSGKILFICWNSKRCTWKYIFPFCVWISFLKTWPPFFWSIPPTLQHLDQKPFPKTYDTINYCPDHIYHGWTIFCFGFVEPVSSKIWNPGWANTELVFEQILDQPVGKSALLVTGTRRRAVMRSNFWTTVGKKRKKEIYEQGGHRFSKSNSQFLLL